MAVYGVLRERGVSIPGEVSIAGYDNHRAIAETLKPGLCTAELPYSAMGVRAAHWLLDLIAHDTAPARAAPVRVCGRVQWRGSVRALATADNIVNLDRRKG